MKYIVQIKQYDDDKYGWEDDASFDNVREALDHLGQHIIDYKSYDVKIVKEVTRMEEVTRLEEVTSVSVGEVFKLEDTK